MLRHRLNSVYGPHGRKDKRKDVTRARQQEEAVCGVVAQGEEGLSSARFGQS
jgi:hypothetical protein